MKTKWEDMDMEEGLRTEGRSEDFIAGAKWSWEATMTAMKMYYGMRQL